jgi:ABC-type glycerol-3-phosphate transport system substrate-binding protein
MKFKNIRRKKMKFTTQFRTSLRGLISILLLASIIVGCTPAATSTEAPVVEATESAPTEAPTAEPTATTPPAVTLRFATNYVGEHAMAAPVKAILEQYQKDYPNVTIEIEETPGNDHQTKIKLDASSDRLPDVFNYWRMDPAFGLDQVVDAGLVADLSDWTQSDPFFTDLFEETAWKTASRDGKVYGIPTLMFYVEFLANKEVLDRAGIQPPTTYEELVSAVETLNAQGELPWGMASKGGGYAVRGYNYVFNRMIGNQRARDMHAGLEEYNVPEVLQALQMMEKLFVGYLPEDAIALDAAAVNAKYINTGEAAFMILGSWENANIAPEIQEKLIVLEFPLVPGGVETEKRIEKDLTNLWYASAKEYNDPVKQFYIQELIKRLSSRDAGKLYAEQGKQPIPMLGTDVDSTLVGALTVASQTLAQERPGNKFIPAAMSADASAKFYPLVAEFFDGKYTPEEFIVLVADITKNQ